MTYLKLKKVVTTNVFTILDVEKYFFDENPHAIRTQLSRFAKKGMITQIKRGLYCFDKIKIDELLLANKLYQPSYVSLERALDYYGIIPDVTQAVTSVNLTTFKKITNEFGNFYYSKIKKSLFFGFTKVKPSKSEAHILIAEPEKALLDYFYIRRIKTTADLRFNLTNLNFPKYRTLSNNFPEWVKAIKL